MPAFSITKEGIVEVNRPRNIDQIRRKILAQKKLLEPIGDLQKSITVPTASFLSPYPSNNLYQAVRKKLRKSRMKKSMLSEPSIAEDKISSHTKPLLPQIIRKVRNPSTKHESICLNSSTVETGITPRNDSRMSPEKFRAFLESHKEEIKFTNLFVISKAVKCGLRNSPLKKPPVSEVSMGKNKKSVKVGGRVANCMEDGEEGGLLPKLPKIRISHNLVNNEKEGKRQKKTVQHGIFKTTTINDSFSSPSSPIECEISQWSPKINFGNKLI